MTIRSTSSMFDHLGIPGNITSERAELIEICNENVSDSVKELLTVVTALDQSELDITIQGIVYSPEMPGFVLTYTRTTNETDEKEDLSNVLLNALLKEMKNLSASMAASRIRDKVPPYQKDRYKEYWNGTYPVTWNISKF